MKRLFYILLVFGLVAVVSASCSKDNTQEEVLEHLENKYKELNRSAEYVTANGVPVAQQIQFLEPDESILPADSNLRQIALIRHGEPDLVKSGKFTYDEAKSFIKNYDSVGIVIPDKPFFKLEESEEVALFTSTIPRAQATARYLFGEERDIVHSADFREFERTIGNRNTSIKLPLNYWTTTARIKWMLGVDREGIESFAEARERARKAAQLLTEASEENPKVILVAHGFLNRYIKKNLEKQGWEVVRDGGDNYFATTILAKVEPEGGKKGPSIAKSDD